MALSTVLQCCPTTSKVGFFGFDLKEVNEGALAVPVGKRKKVFCIFSHLLGSALKKRKVEVTTTVLHKTHETFCGHKDIMQLHKLKLYLAAERKSVSNACQSVIAVVTCTKLIGKI